MGRTLKNFLLMGVCNQNSLESTGLEPGEALQTACPTIRLPAFLTTTAEYPRHMQTSSNNKRSCTSETEVRLHCYIQTPNTHKKKPQPPNKKFAPCPTPATWLSRQKHPQLSAPHAHKTREKCLLTLTWCLL